MPLPNDEKLIALSEEILKQLEAMFGPHPGFRPVHAKGILLTGTFTPSECGSVADAGATCGAGFDSSDGEVFGWDGSSADSRQRSACGSAGHGDPVQPCRACAHGHCGALS